MNILTVYTRSDSTKIKIVEGLEQNHGSMAAKKKVCVCVQKTC